MYALDVPYMETKRLILRETKESDFVDMFEYAKLPNVGPVAGWAPHRRLGETKAILRLFNDKKLCGQLGTIAIVYKENNKKMNEMSRRIEGYRSFGNFFDDVKMKSDYTDYNSKISDMEKKLQAYEDKWYNKYKRWNIRS